METVLAVAAGGWQVAQAALAADAAALANAQTPGYGRRVVAVAEGPAVPARPADTVLAGQALPPALGLSGGAQVAGMAVRFGADTAASPVPTNLAIAGAGFFAVRTAQGVAYTRAGAFQPDAQGWLTLPNGARLVPPVRVPPGGTLRVAADGTVWVGSGAAAQPRGRLQVALFANPAGLQSLGEGLWAPTPASGPPRLVAPGTAGSGRVVAGALNGSGVSGTALLPALVRWQGVAQADAAVWRVAQQATQAELHTVG